MSIAELEKRPAKQGKENTGSGKAETASPLRMLRLQKGISQKDLAEKVGMERTRLVRLEQKKWQEVSLGDLEAISAALGARLHELILKFGGFGKEGLSDRVQLSQPYFKMDSGKGFRFASLLKQPEGCFVGTVQIDPRKSVPVEETPKADFLYYLVLEGDLLVTLSGKEYRMREKDSFTVDGARSYEFYNPHQFKETQLLAVSIPAFLKGI